MEHSKDPGLQEVEDFLTEGRDVFHYNPHQSKKRSPGPAHRLQNFDRKNAWYGPIILYQL